MMLLFFITVALATSILFVVYYIINGIPPMPSSRKARDQILNILSRHSASKIYELGCGWGTIVFPVAKSKQETQIIGLENFPIPFLFCVLRKLFDRSDNLRLCFGDFYEASLKEADILICYLYPGAMLKLKDKFEKELKSGTLIISNTFSIPGWEPQNIYSLEDIYKTQIFVYEV